MKESPTDQRPISHHISSDANCHWPTTEPICFSASVRKSLQQRSVCVTLAPPESPSICKLALQRALKATSAQKLTA